MIYYLSFTVFILDRLLKLLVSVNLDYGESVRLLPFLNITYLHNTGIAFSLFTGNNSLLTLVNLGVIVILIIVLVLSKRTKGLEYTAYGLILGGAISNLWDRYFYSGVIDYIDFKVWPVFNIADSAITVGAFLIAATVFFDIVGKKKKVNLS
ncbi:MAG: signal peptidase II [Elusimicrobiota bacterium]